MKNDDIAENVLQYGKEGVRQNMVEALNEFCEEYADEMYKAVEEVIRLRAENAALRLAVQYLIDDGGADCCAKCIYCPHPTSEDDDCDCHHKGDCVNGMSKWFAEERKDEQN